MTISKHQVDTHSTDIFSTQYTNLFGHPVCVPPRCSVCVCVKSSAAGETRASLPTNIPACVSAAAPVDRPRGLTILATSNYPVGMTVGGGGEGASGDAQEYQKRVGSRTHTA